MVRRPIQWLAVTILLTGAALWVATLESLQWPHSVTFLLGEPIGSLRWTAVFLVGGCYFMFRRNIAFKPGILCAVLAGLVVVDVLVPQHLFFPFAILGGYVMFYIAQLPGVSRIKVARLPDISYRVYLYGWPVESLWIHYRHGSPWITFLRPLSSASFSGG
jgi:hypothetical protein